MRLPRLKKKTRFPLYVPKAAFHYLDLPQRIVPVLFVTFGFKLLWLFLKNLIIFRRWTSTPTETHNIGKWAMNRFTCINMECVVLSPGILTHLVGAAWLKSTPQIRKVWAKNFSSQHVALPRTKESLSYLGIWQSMTRNQGTHACIHTCTHVKKQLWNKVKLQQEVSQTTCSRNQQASQWLGYP